MEKSLKILKNILIGLGVIFILVISLFVFLASESSEFTDKHTNFVENFVKEFSVNWDIADVHSDVTNDMLRQIKTLDGQKAISTFMQLGKLISIDNLSLINYSSNTSGDSGIFEYKGQFQNGAALVRIEVIEKDENVKVHTLNITFIDDIKPQMSNHKA